MSCFAMRRESQLKPYNGNSTLPSEINTQKKAESIQRLPCMSSFIHLKRQRLNLTTASIPQECPPHVDKKSDGNHKDCVLQSNFDNESHGANLIDCQEPSKVMPYAPAQGFNSNAEFPKFVYQGQYANSDLSTDEKIDYFFREKSGTACEQHRQEHVGVWLAPREDIYSCVQENGSTSSDIGCLTAMTPSDSTSCAYSVDQPLDSNNTHGDGQFYPTNTLTSHHSETWSSLPNQTSDQCEPLYQTPSAAILYEHLSSSSTSSSSSGFMAYSMTDGYSYVSNSSSEDEMRFMPEAGNGAVNNSGDDLNFHWQGQYDRHAELEFQSHGTTPQSSSEMTNGGMSAADGMGYIHPTELSRHHEASLESNPGVNSDFVFGSSWSWLNNDNNNDTKNNDSNGNSNLTNGVMVVEDNSGTDAGNLTSTSRPRNIYSKDITDDVSKNVKDDARIDDDSGDGLKLKGRKTDLSYMALISKAILSSPDQRMLLSDIYDYLSQNYTEIKSNQRAWRNSVRHNLSLNECFVKQERLGRGRGHYWSIHPACVDDFIRGDFRRRQARRRAKKCSFGKDDQPAMGSSLSMETAVAGHVDIINYSRGSDYHKALDIQTVNANG